MCVCVCVCVCIYIYACMQNVFSDRHTSRKLKTHVRRQRSHTPTPKVTHANAHYTVCSLTDLEYVPS